MSTLYSILKCVQNIQTQNQKYVDIMILVDKSIPSLHVPKQVSIPKAIQSIAKDNENNKTGIKKRV
jgi:hypothetical protein